MHQKIPSIIRIAAGVRVARLILAMAFIIRKPSTLSIYSLQPVRL